MKKTTLFVFSGDLTVFAHALLNAIDMKNRGYDVRVVVEGDAVKQVSLLRNETKPFAPLYKRAKEAGLIGCVCKACAAKLGVMPAVIEQGLPTCDDIEGHPSVARYIEDGCEVLVF